METRKVLIAIGGNSLITDQNRQSVPDQYAAALGTCQKIATVIEAGWKVVMTHGNGPQVGFMLLRSEMSRHAIHEVPLVSCVADTQGALGFHLQMALGNALAERGLEGRAATIVTQCVVEPDDPSFESPSKPVGLFYSREDALRKTESLGWVMARDSNRGFRRVVPSPRPREIVELEAIRRLFESGVTVIAAGGGGIPVVRDPDGVIRGVDAVIDKDYASALLARELGIGVLAISTGVPGVYLRFGELDQQLIGEIDIAGIERFRDEGHFGRGSMAPKIEAAVEFLRGGGKEVVITSPDLLPAALEGGAGTRIVS